MRRQASGFYAEALEYDLLIVGEELEAGEVLGGDFRNAAWALAFELLIRPQCWAPADRASWLLT